MAELIKPCKGAIETYDEFGILHSYNDEPAQILIRGSKRWCYHGLLHRDNDNPAAIIFSGMVVIVKYATFGKVYKEVTYNDGALYYKKHGNLDGCPVSEIKESFKSGCNCRTIYDSDGNIISKAYTNDNNQKGRDGEDVLFNAKPVAVTYYNNGNIKTEGWYVDGYLYRLDGPAKIKYNEDGTIKKQTYSIIRNISKLNDEVLDSIFKLNLLGV